MRAESGLELGTGPLPEPSERIDTLVLAGGSGADAAAGDEALVSWVRHAAPRCRRVATVCSGAFLAAAAGLLDGRRVTTHWARAGQLRAAYPALTVDPDPIYIRDGKYWSSAGVTAGIDLSLALVQEDLGVDVAQTVARWLVMFLHRPGGQTQFASPVWVPRAERSTVRAVQTVVEAAPGGDHRLPALAAAAAMSVRHFTRVFTAEVGETPSRFVERTRLEAARRELEETDGHPRCRRDALRVGQCRDTPPGLPTSSGRVARRLSAPFRARPPRRGHRHDRPRAASPSRSSPSSRRSTPSGPTRSSSASRPSTSPSSVTPAASCAARTACSA